MPKIYAIADLHLSHAVPDKAMDVFGAHWANHTERLVAVHLNDAVAGVPYQEQRDMQRRLPMETGVIDTADILRRFKASPNDALYMIEPFEPGRTRFHAMTAEDAVRAAGEVFAAMEKTGHTV